MDQIAVDRPTWAGRVPRHLIERLYVAESKGILDDDLIDEVGYALLARCETILAFTRNCGRPTCPGCLVAMDLDGEAAVCPGCGWSTTRDEYRRFHRKKHLHAGRMEPFLEAFVADFERARSPRDKMLLIDILIHRCHGDYEQVGGLRLGAINLIGGKPREVSEFLDRLGGVRRSELDVEADHAAWVDRVRRERGPGWRAATGIQDIHATASTDAMP